MKEEVETQVSRSHSFSVPEALPQIPRLPQAYVENHCIVARPTGSWGKKKKKIIGDTVLREGFMSRRE